MTAASWPGCPDDRDERDDEDRDPWPPDAGDSGAEVSEVRPAKAELLVFAAAVRGERWASLLGAAVDGAESAGWEWERIARKACALILSAAGEPLMLAEAVRRPDPIHDQSPASPPTSDYRQARQALAAAAAPKGDDHDA